jgi:hypothetical protein
MRGRRAAVRVGDGLDDGESEAGPLWQSCCRWPAPERLERSRADSSSKTGALVPYVDEQPAGFG